jgi:hypothetical protein
MAAQRVKLVVPAKFWDDHCDRETEYTVFSEYGISSDERTLEIKRTGNKITLSINTLCIAELASDAYYYATGMQGEPDLNPLIASARATIKALAKAGYEYPVATGDHSEYLKAAS